jgi:hypothetical protein
MRSFFHALYFTLLLVITSNTSLHAQDFYERVQTLKVELQKSTSLEEARSAIWIWTSLRSSSQGERYSSREYFQLLGFLKTVSESELRALPPHSAQALLYELGLTPTFVAEIYEALPWEMYARQAHVLEQSVWGWAYLLVSSPRMIAFPVFAYVIWLEWKLSVQGLLPVGVTQDLVKSILYISAGSALLHLFSRPAFVLAEVEQKVLDGATKTINRNEFTQVKDLIPLTSVLRACYGLRDK